MKIMLIYLRNCNQHMDEFFPPNQSIPEELIFGKVKIRPLRASDNELDYKAVIESGFRPEGFPKEANLKELTAHEKDHDMKKEFTFTILDVDETECYGCIYIRPVIPFLKFAFFNDRILEELQIQKKDPGFSFWITPTARKLNLYEKLLEELPKWFKREWPYENWYMLGIGQSEREIETISRLKLSQTFLLQMEDQKFILWKFI
ncbi:MAG: hypothetical protein ACFFBL_07720 [Promethearchaeota archaeon]